MSHSPSARVPRTLPLLLTLAVLALVGLVVPAGARAQASPPAGMGDTDYLGLADRLQVALEPSWKEREGLYSAGDGSEPIINSNMLLVHAVAARMGHGGPARNDERARRIAARLVSSPPFVEQPSAGPPGSKSQAHAPGWVNTTWSAGGAQHLVFDADVVDGLVQAWLSRDALGLPAETAALIVDRVVRTTAGSFWRFPAMRLNQINWYALMYASSATLTGDPTLLREDFRAQVMRFTAGAQGFGPRAGNFGAGMRFHYLPGQPADRRLNVDSAEYANIVFSFARFWEQAYGAGMAPLPGRDRRILRQWGARVLAGYWTHGGYLNWDTGLSFNRWHQTKKLGLAQQALLGLAMADGLQTENSRGEWAKWMFDRSLRLYDRWTAEAGGVPPGLSFGVDRVPQGPSSARLGAARVAANAARAVAAGLGRQASEEPPPLYAFDPEIGRLAVTTPAYNTAIVAVNQGGFPYGGIDLARLYDGDQEPAANIGGRPPAAFGLSLYGRDGRRIAATQVGRTRLDPAHTPLELDKAPRGAGAQASSPVGRSFAGPFEDLRASGEIVTATHVLRSRHRFTPWFVQTDWSARSRTRKRAARAASAQVHFPSTGADVQVSAVLRDGRRFPVGEQPLALRAVSYFHIASSRSGYVVVPRRPPSGARAYLLGVTRQWSAPRAGPTLVVEIARGRSIRRAALSARMVPVRNPDAAGATARALGAR